MYRSGRLLIEGMYVQVDVKPSSGSKVEIELVATNTGSNLALHWGALQPGRSEWVVPPAGMRLPEGTTRAPDDAALRTPFKNVCYAHPK
jgi:alpha-glucan,water dikinase